MLDGLELVRSELARSEFARSEFVRSEPEAADDEADADAELRPLLPGGVNARDVPALGFSIEFAPFAPCDTADSPEPSRPPAGTAPTWLCCILCRRLAVCCWNDCGRETLLCDPKKCSEPLRTVDGAAARPLADRLARDGTTGRLPAIMRAPPNCSRVAAAAVTWPAPKRPALTVDIARET